MKTPMCPANNLRWADVKLQVQLKMEDSKRETNISSNKLKEYRWLTAVIFMNT